MKTIDIIRSLFTSAVEIEQPLMATNPHYVAMGEALLALNRLVIAYDSIAPDWAKLPQWAQWYAIDAKGYAYAYADEPRCVPDLGEWQLQGWHGWHESGRGVLWVDVENIGDGIDWRDCIWKRQEAIA